MVLYLSLNFERLQKLIENYVVSNAKIINAMGKSLPISSKEGLLKTFNHFIMFSRIFGLFLLICFSPLFVLLGLVIVLEDGFPVFFKQKRVGKNYTFFHIYKFRSMRKDTPNVATHLLGDPAKYVLKVGGLLRKLSLDELSNLINIVKGEMVFVGPRPALYNQDDLMALRVASKVDQLTPGITGWAQINGRDELSNEEKVRYEKEYLDRKSFVFDTRIVVMTFMHVLASKGVAH